MNNDQLKHIVTVLHAIAVGQFAVFGYTGLTSQTVQWLQIGLSSLGFLNIESWCAYSHQPGLLAGSKPA